jgi:hypothetical protein
MPIANLNSRAQIVILAARKELQPAAGERERLEALLNARIGYGGRGVSAGREQSLPGSASSAR